MVISLQNTDSTCDLVAVDVVTKQRTVLQKGIECDDSLSVDSGKRAALIGDDDILLPIDIDTGQPLSSALTLPVATMPASENSSRYDSQLAQAGFIEGGPIGVVMGDSQVCELFSHRDDKWNSLFSTNRDQHPHCQLLSSAQSGFGSIDYFPWNSKLHDDWLKKQETKQLSEEQEDDGAHYQHLLTFHFPEGDSKLEVVSDADDRGLEGAICLQVSLVPVGASKAMELAGQGCSAQVVGRYLLVTRTRNDQPGATLVKGGGVIPNPRSNRLYDLETGQDILGECPEQTVLIP